jgi:hypothetical protein
MTFKFKLRFASQNSREGERKLSLVNLRDSEDCALDNDWNDFVACRRTTVT